VSVTLLLMYLVSAQPSPMPADSSALVRTNLFLGHWEGVSLANEGSRYHFTFLQSSNEIKGVCWTTLVSEHLQAWDVVKASSTDSRVQGWMEPHSRRTSIAHHFSGRLIDSTTAEVRVQFADAAEEVILHRTARGIDCLSEASTNLLTFLEPQRDTAEIRKFKHQEAVFFLVFRSTNAPLHNPPYWPATPPVYIFNKNGGLVDWCCEQSSGQTFLAKWHSAATSTAVNVKEVRKFLTKPSDR